LVEKIPSWIERLLLPKLSEIFGEIKALSARIDSLERTTNERITSLRNEMIVKFDSIEKRMPLIEKIMELEARLARLEGKA
jgi:hypothetical protein